MGVEARADIDGVVYVQGMSSLNEEDEPDATKLTSDSTPQGCDHDDRPDCET